MESKTPNIIPRERQFFTLFREDVDNLRNAIRVLEEMLASTDDFPSFARRLNDLEHQGDDITHRIVRELNTTFVTPFDRDDIYALAAKLDDVLDLVEETADTICLDGITTITPEAREMGTILAKIADTLVIAIDELETRENIREHVVRVHELENQGDRVTRSAISDLFRTSTDAIHIIKWKDIYALLEKTVDTAEDIAKVLENVMIKTQR
jgi:predicted phosphate transport protein (TIGR00153 family)